MPVEGRGNRVTPYRFAVPKALLFADCGIPVESPPHSRGGTGGSNPLSSAGESVLTSAQKLGSASGNLGPGSNARTKKLEPIGARPER
jgi:hypothetical protein